MYKACIIGAGAAGLIAAIEASSARGDILILDKNKKAGMKLYATGNGRCNLANLHMASSCYYDNNFATDILGEKPSDFVIQYMHKLGVSCYDKNGYVYPRSNQASTVVWALLDRLKRDNITLKTGIEAGIITEDNDYYTVKDINGKEICKAENVIISTGGISMPKLGAASETTTGKLFDSLSIKYNSFKPSLCPIVCEPESSGNISDISGVRSNGRVTVTTRDGRKYSEDGEVQFTDYGLSGIVVFDLSYYDDIKTITIDTLFDISEDEFVSLFNITKENNPTRTLHGFLNGFINDKLAAYIIKCVGLSLKQELSDSDIESAERIYMAARNITYTFKSLYGYTHSQVTKGGIICEEINPLTMQLKNRRGLYAVGEAIDVCGKCGGYNLMWAMRSGYLAGKNIREKQ
ncbi:MAG: aminoacetone oxidase family FAD-binding enzyme [Eubacterium sp.]|nr:aminoacetone oxidase family FAD-binding enzyme [Eubacterium sp.]